MKKLNSVKSRDQQILSCIKWASNLLFKLRGKRLWNGHMDKICQTAEEKEDLKKDDPALIGLTRPFMIGKFETKPFIATLEQTIVIDEDYYDGSPPETTGEEWGFVLQIMERGEDPGSYFCITFLVSPKEDKKPRIPKGWRKRIPRDSTYSDDRVYPYAPLLVHYLTKEGRIYRPIDYFIQAAILAVQEGFLSGPDCLLTPFKKYIFSTFKESDPLDKSVRAIGYYDETECEEDGKRRGKVSFNLPTANLQRRAGRWRIDLREVDKNILREALRIIVKGYYQPYNSTTFEVLVRKTIAGLLKTKLGIPRKYEYQPKVSPEIRGMRRDILFAYSKKYSVKNESARRWLTRELKKKTLSEIWLRFACNKK